MTQPEPETRPEPETPRSELVREAWLAGVGILVALGAIKHLGQGIPLIRNYGFTLAVGLQLYIPLLLRGRRGISNESLGLTLKAWRVDLGSFLIWALVVTVPFVVGHHVWQTQFMGRPFVFGVPDNIVERLLLQTVVVALAEEIFFRGYLQERLQKIWPAKGKLFGAPFGLAIVVSSAVFALAHFVGEREWAHLDIAGTAWNTRERDWVGGSTGTGVGARLLVEYLMRRP